MVKNALDVRRVEKVVVVVLILVVVILVLVLVLIIMFQLNAVVAAIELNQVAITITV